MLKLQIIGRLGGDAEIKSKDGGLRWIAFSVAHSEKFKYKGEPTEKTTWVRCTKWLREGDSDAVVPYLKKGGQVYVEGMPAINTFSGDDGQHHASLDLRVSHIELLGGKQGGEEQAEAIEKSIQAVGREINLEDDDLPF